MGLEQKEGKKRQNFYFSFELSL